MTPRYELTHFPLALTAGVPLDLVRKVARHKTTDIVLKPYFQPGREDFCQTLQSAMPKLLTNRHKTPKEEMREPLDQVKPKALLKRLLKVWAKWRAGRAAAAVASPAQRQVQAAAPESNFSQGGLPPALTFDSPDLGFVSRARHFAMRSGASCTA
jgi:ribosomal protein L13E